MRKEKKSPQKRGYFKSGGVFEFEIAGIMPDWRMILRFWKNGPIFGTDLPVFFNGHPEMFQ